MADKARLQIKTNGDPEAWSDVGTASYSLPVIDTVANALVPVAYDYISMSYTDGNLTGVIYKTGGASGTTVATLTLGYDGSNNLTSVTKS
jgi:hypothetical protein